MTQSPGAEGELLIRGLAVGYGYLGDDAKTNAVFIQNPLHNTYHDPLYCSGDLVRLDEDGNILFLDRLDDQIKFHGNRIELGEIEAALAGLDLIEEVVVVFNNADNPDEQEIGALFSKCVKIDDDASLEQVREALSCRIPEYMIPTRMEVTDQNLPLTANGKYDRKAVRGLLF